MKTYTFLRSAFLLSCLLMSFASRVSAQDHTVNPVSDYLQTFKDKHQLILNDVQTRTDLTITQKLVLYESEISKLKAEFKATRVKDYQSKSIELSVSHSCTKGSSGGVLNCGWVSVSTPSSDMYTKDEWLRVEGENKGTKVEPGGSAASLLMTRASKGRNEGTLYATFKYKPENIPLLVDKDTTELFNQVVSK